VNLLIRSVQYVERNDRRLLLVKFTKIIYCTSKLLSDSKVIENDGPKRAAFQISAADGEIQEHCNLSKCSKCFALGYGDKNAS